MPMPNRSPASLSFHRSLVTFACGALISIAIAGCSTQAETFAPAALPPPPPPPVVALPHPAAPTRVTTASWYGPGFDGHTTSSGEVYHQQALTAASRTLPIGAHAKVTNLKTGKSVVVRINDHGPFVRGRGIDLSRAAAKKIGVDHHGVAKVAVTRVDRPVGEMPDSSTKLAKKHDDALPTTPTTGGAMPPVMESSVLPTSMGSSSKESPPPAH